MTKKKQDLDLNVVRGFDLATEQKDDIATWQLSTEKSSNCPFPRGRLGCQTNRKFCERLFPEIIGKIFGHGYQKCPCHILKVKDVIKIAQEAVK